MSYLSNPSVAYSDPELWSALDAEFQRQEDHLELIASENYTSPAVMEAQGSVLTNKYAEGYPGKRYYGGCEHVDKVETLAIERAKALFSAAYANVQPHSGASANAAVYAAVVKPGETVLGMSLAHGGHLTHGSPVNFSGRLYNVVSYGLNEKTELIDYDEVAKLAKQHQPKMIVAGASAYSRVIDWARFAQIAKDVGAVFFVDMAHYAGLVAAGLYPNPMPVADIVSSTTHKTLRGPRGGFILTTSAHEKAVASAVFPGQQGGPLMHVIAAKAVAFKEAQSDRFKDYQHLVIANARQLAATLQKRGVRIVSGGTDCHMFLVDLRPKKLTGKATEEALGRCNITVNKNAVPNDPEKPMVTSGIRIGTPALTTRGFDEAACEQLGNLIADVLDAPANDAVLEKVTGAVAELCDAYPVYYRGFTDRRQGPRERRRENLAQMVPDKQ